MPSSSSSPLSVLSQVAQAGQQVGSDVKGIQLKNANVNQYRNATKAPQSSPSVPSTSGADKTNKGASGKYGSRPGEMRPDQVLGSFKKGGKVKKAGVYKLHAKERVLNAKQTAKMEGKGGLAMLSGKK
jgi:hypothetical protein